MLRPVTTGLAYELAETRFPRLEAANSRREDPPARGLARFDAGPFDDLDDLVMLTRIFERLPVVKDAIRAKTRRILQIVASNAETPHKGPACTGDSESGGAEPGYPKRSPAQLIALNLLVEGSTPSRPTKFKHLCGPQHAGCLSLSGHRSESALGLKHLQDRPNDRPNDRPGSSEIYKGSFERGILGSVAVV